MLEAFPQLADLKKEIRVKKTLVLCVAIAATLTVLLAASGSAGAAGGQVVYNSTATPLPGNLASWAFEATSTSEYGDQVTLAGTARSLNSVTVTMSSWGCQSGHWYTNDCVTTPGATFSVPITLNVYNVGPNNSVGSLITSSTQTFAIPYRPSADNVHCTGSAAGEWYSSADNSCYNGLATNITFEFPSDPLIPNTVIWSVAFNTSDYGYSPYGNNTACHATSGGCGYDSLNVGLTESVAAGSRPVPNSDYLNSRYGQFYCDGGNAGTGAFRFDSANTSNPPGECDIAGIFRGPYSASDWFGGYAPAALFSASPSGNVNCDAAIGATTIDGNLIVPAGATCTLDGTTVTHDVQVQNGGTLIDNGATIGHDLTANNPKAIGIGHGGSIGHDLKIDGVTGYGPGSGGANYVCNTTVGHDLVVENGQSGAGMLNIGALYCVGHNTVGHDLKVINNANKVDVENNIVSHDLVVSGNTGGTTVSKNTAGHDATCQANDPTATGSGNTASHNNTCPAPAP